MWNPEDNLRSLTSAAKDKLGIKDYDIVDLLAEADINALNEWLVNTDEQSYDSFVNEFGILTVTEHNNQFFIRITLIPITHALTFLKALSHYLVGKYTCCH